MPNKSFSLYSAKEDMAVGGYQLLLEIARSHMACLVFNVNNRSVSAFELFTFLESETADFAQLFKLISVNSVILDKPHAAVEIFFNNELSVPVPASKFNEEIAADYLNIAFSENPFSKTCFEPIEAEPEITNVFRVNNDLSNVLHAQFPKVTFRHTWSNIIKSLSAKTSLFPSEFISIQFYNTFFVVAFLKHSKINFIQSFVYETSEDVLYYLLNMCGHLGLDFEEVTLQISGMIDLDFNLYRELIKYFKHINVKNADQQNMVLDIKEYPLHYFTPFFNLTL